MAVSTARQIWKGRDGEDDDDGTSRYSQIFRVETTSAFDTASTIHASGLVPIRGDSFSGNTNAICNRVVSKNESFSPKIWLTTCTFSTKIVDFELPVEPFDPLELKAEITWDTEQFQSAAIENRDGTALTNSAGDPFDPPATVDDSRPVATIVKNHTGVPFYVLTYRRAVNASPFMIDGIQIESRQAKIQRISIGTRLRQNLINYRVVTITMQFDPDTWDIKILDQGRRQIVDTTKRENIRNDKDQTSVPYNVLLDGDGGVLVNPSPANANYKTFRYYEEKDFSILKLT